MSVAVVPVVWAEAIAAYSTWMIVANRSATQFERGGSSCNTWRAVSVSVRGR